MKPETEKGLRAASNETRQEIIKLLAELMPADLFVGALTEDGRDLTDDGQIIFKHLDAEFGDGDPEISETQLTRIHEAICENRKEDAIDVLREIGGYFRTVAEQKHLFPGRYEADAL